MNWKTLSLSTSLTLSAVLLGYSHVPAGAQTAPSSGSMMQHSGASSCDAKGSAMSGDAMSGSTNGDAMSGSAMSGDAMSGDAMSGSTSGDVMSGDAMSGSMSSDATASGATGDCNAPSGATPSSTGAR